MEKLTPESLDRVFLLYPSPDLSLQEYAQMKFIRVAEDIYVGPILPYHMAIMAALGLHANQVSDSGYMTIHKSDQGLKSIRLLMDSDIPYIREAGQREGTGAILSKIFGIHVSIRS